MEQQLFKDLDHGLRIQKLRDGCDKVKEQTYFKRFDATEISEVKDVLTDTMINLKACESELNDIKKEFKERIDVMKDAINESLEKAKLRGEMVTEECYIMYDYDNNQAAVYNRMGERIELRPLNADERNKVIQFNERQKDGTND
jgi:hypothetical protein